MHIQGERDFTGFFRFVNLEEHAIILDGSIMAPILDQIMSWLGTPQGNTLYSVVLGVSVFFALSAAWYASGSNLSDEWKRLQRGLLLLFSVQVLLFIVNWLAWLGIINGHAYLPPVERTVALFSLVLIIWLWAFIKPKRLETGVVIALEAVILLGGVFGLIWWLNSNANAYYSTSFLVHMPASSALHSVVGAMLLLWATRYLGLWPWHVGYFLLGYGAISHPQQPAIMPVRAPGEMVSYLLPQ
jgi:hypothetical protein